MNARSSKASPCLWLGTLLVLGLSCGRPSTPAVVITVTGALEGIRSIHPLVTLDGRPTPFIKPIDQGLTQLGLQLEPGARGKLRVELHGIPDHPFAVSTGTAEVDIMADSRSELTIALSPPGDVCTKTGWCWENPLPHGRSLRDVWGTSAQDVYAVGEFGTIMHWDGADWRMEDSGTTLDLHTVWGSGPDVVWALAGVPYSVRGTSGVFRRRNGRWQSALTDLDVPSLSLPSTRILSIWGNAEEVWIGGYSDAASPKVSGPFILVYSAGQYSVRWTQSTTALFDNLQINGIWGTDANNVWAIGTGDGNTVKGPPRLYRYDGQAMKWSREAIGNVPIGDAFAGLTGIAGDSSGNLWLVGTSMSGRPLLQRRIGGAWQTTPREVSDQAASPKVSVDATGRAWIAAAQGGPGGGLWRYRDEKSALVLSPTDCMRGCQAAWAWQDEVWAVGRVGAVIHVRDQDVVDRQLPAPRAPAFRAISSLWGDAQGTIWAGGEEGLLTRRGERWEDVALPASGGKPFVSGIWGSAPDDVWALSTDLFHFDGSAWTRVQPMPPLPGAAKIWGRARDDVWIFGSSALHFDGTRWESRSTGLPAMVQVTGLWGPSATEVWSGGYIADRTTPAKLTLYRYDGATWTDRTSMLPSPTALREPGDIVGFADGSFWFVMNTHAGVNARCAGGTCQMVQAGYNILYRIWATAPNDIWLLSRPEDFARWDGTRSVHITIGATTPWARTAFSQGVVGSDAFDISVGGDEGMMLRCRGKACGDAAN